MISRFSFHEFGYMVVSLEPHRLPIQSSIMTNPQLLQCVFTETSADGWTAEDFCGRSADRKRGYGVDNQAIISHGH